jgi:hypothetical protein
MTQDGAGLRLIHENNYAAAKRLAQELNR